MKKKDDEFDDEEGRLLFNSDAINHMVESNVLNKLNDYSVNSGSSQWGMPVGRIVRGILKINATK